MNKNIKKKVSEFWKDNKLTIEAIAVCGACTFAGMFCGYQMGYFSGYLNCFGSTIESIHKF